MSDFLKRSGVPNWSKDFSGMDEQRLARMYKDHIGLPQTDQRYQSCVAAIKFGYDNRTLSWDEMKVVSDNYLGEQELTPYSIPGNYVDSGIYVGWQVGQPQQW